MNFDIIRLGINKNADDAHFVWSSNPWFKRGGMYSMGLAAGVFAFANTNGHVNGNNSFRVVLRTIFKNKFKNNQKEIEKNRINFQSKILKNLIKRVI